MKSVLTMPFTIFTSILLIIFIKSGETTNLRSGLTGSEIVFKIKEELDVGTKIANVVELAGIGTSQTKEEMKKLRYKFLTRPSIAISLDEKSGDIITSGRIDRETVCGDQGRGLGGSPLGQRDDEVCKIPLDVAVHRVGYFQNVKLILEIEDVNDNSPEFRPSHVTHEWAESSQPGASFVIPTAHDLDTKSLSVTKYDLQDPTETLKLIVSKKLDGSTEVRLALQQPLDRETREVLNVKVVAYDAGIPPRSGSVDVTIRVLDSNDNQPVFEYNSYEVTVLENLPISKTIVTVSATDKDLGANAEVHYSLSPSTLTNYGDIFTVDGFSGDVVVIGNVDYEKNSVYHLIVMATDRGPDAIPSETTVIVKVEDTNDNAPQVTINTLFASDTSTAEVLENADVGTFVGYVIVHDPDRGNNGRFNCSVDRQQYFRLQPVFNREYHLVTSQTFDREYAEKYDVIIVCADGGTPPLESVRRVTVTVTDVNDNAPQFIQKCYAAELLENNFIGAFIIKASATDADSGVNAIVAYRLASTSSYNIESNKHLPRNNLSIMLEPSKGSDNQFIELTDDMLSQLFKIDSKSGVITALKQFDRERMKGFHFLVVAEDLEGRQGTPGHPMLSAVAEVRVTVLDVNDERPVFSAPVYDFTIEENLPLGSVVGFLSATDADDPPYNEFLFSTQSSGSFSDAFIVHTTSGRVATSRELDREERDYYSFVVVVTDAKTKAQSSTAIVNVRVLDVNDHSPVFRFPTVTNGTVHVETPISVNTIVAKVHAEDADIGDNAKITYSLTKGDEMNIFELNPQSGALTVTRDLQRVDNNMSVLVITASDSGAENSKTFAYLTVVFTKPNASGRKALSGIWMLFSGGSTFTILVICGISMIIIVVLITAIAAVVCQRPCCCCCCRDRDGQGSSSIHGSGGGCCAGGRQKSNYNCRLEEQLKINGKSKNSKLDCAPRYEDVVSHVIDARNYDVTMMDLPETAICDDVSSRCGSTLEIRQKNTQSPQDWRDSGNQTRTSDIERQLGCMLEDVDAGCSRMETLKIRNASNDLNADPSGPWSPRNIPEAHSDYSSSESIVSSLTRRRNQNDEIQALPSNGVCDVTGQQQQLLGTQQQIRKNSATAGLQSGRITPLLPYNQVSSLRRGSVGDTGSVHSAPGAVTGTLEGLPELGEGGREVDRSPGGPYSPRRANQPQPIPLLFHRPGFPVDKSIGLPQMRDIGPLSPPFSQPLFERENVYKDLSCLTLQPGMTGPRNGYLVDPYQPQTLPSIQSRSDGRHMTTFKGNPAQGFHLPQNSFSNDTSGFKHSSLQRNGVPNGFIPHPTDKHNIPDPNHLKRTASFDANGSHIPDIPQSDRIVTSLRGPSEQLQPGPFQLLKESISANKLTAAPSTVGGPYNGRADGNPTYQNILAVAISDMQGNQWPKNHQGPRQDYSVSESSPTTRSQANGRSHNVKFAADVDMNGYNHNRKLVNAASSG